VNASCLDRHCQSRSPPASTHPATLRRPCPTAQTGLLLLLFASNRPTPNACGGGRPPRMCGGNDGPATANMVTHRNECTRIDFGLLFRRPVSKRKHDHRMEHAWIEYTEAYSNDGDQQCRFPHGKHGWLFVFVVARTVFSLKYTPTLTPHLCRRRRVRRF
jgi:hypothetical protein